MNAPDDWPQPILDLLDGTGDPPHPDDPQVREILERHAEFREEVTTFLWLRREVHAACASDESASELAMPADTRAALRARATATLGRTSRHPIGRSRQGAPRILRIVPWLAAAAAILWLAFALQRTDRNTVVEGPSYAARFEARRITVRAADDPAWVLRVRATLPAKGYLIVLGVRPDGNTFAMYPQLTERGVSDEGVRGPFDAGAEFVFPPVTEPALTIPAVDGDLTVTFAMTSTEFAATELRTLIRTVAEASRGATAEARLEAIERVLSERCREISHAVLANDDVE